MRRNTLKEKIQRNETAHGVLVAWPSPELVEFLGHLGFDYVLIDAEHGYISPETCANMVRACDVADTVPVVRVPENNQSTILRYLETGALGVVVPHVRSAGEARVAAAATRYRGNGRRSAAQSTRRANYGLTQSTSEYFAWADENILLHVMIEDRQGIENLDEILAVEEIDVVTFGAGDLALDLGYPGEPEHPEVQNVMNDANQRIQQTKPANLRLAYAVNLLREAGREFLSS